jgi:hypothetical protein
MISETEDRLLYLERTVELLLKSLNEDLYPRVKAMEKVLANELVKREGYHSPEYGVWHPGARTNCTICGAK